MSLSVQINAQRLIKNDSKSTLSSYDYGSDVVHIHVHLHTHTYANTPTHVHIQISSQYVDI